MLELLVCGDYDRVETVLSTSQAAQQLSDNRTEPDGMMNGSTTTTTSSSTEHMVHDDDVNDDVTDDDGDISDTPAARTTSEV